MPDLARFHAPQSRDLPTAVAEISAGRKLTHWIWWIFPQLRALGRSARAVEFGLADLSEAREFLADPVLRASLLTATEAVLRHPGRDIESVMGPVDALKLRSSMTLFEAAAPDAATRAPFAAVLNTFYGGARCPLTLREFGA